MSELEDEIRRIVRQEVRSALSGLAARLDPVGEQLERVPNRTVADPEHNGEVDVALCPCQACRLICEFANRDDLVSKTHESSFHVAGPVLATPDLPATIMVGTPDTDPSQGDGASVEGPAPRSGPSTSSGPLIVPTWTFGDRLRKARRHRGMHQRTLGQHLDVSAATIGMWEKDINLPRNLAQAARELQDLLRVPAWWLLGVDRP